MRESYSLCSATNSLSLRGLVSWQKETIFYQFCSHMFLNLTILSHWFYEQTWATEPTNNLNNEQVCLVLLRSFKLYFIYFVRKLVSCKQSYYSNIHAVVVIDCNKLLDTNSTFLYYYCNTYQRTASTLTSSDKHERIHAERKQTYWQRHHC